MHGAGVIEDFEEELIDGKNRQYYVLRIPVGNLKIMVSIENIDNMNIRRVLAPEQLDQIMGQVTAAPLTICSNDWNQRYKDNMEKIRSGCLAEIAMVFRNLHQRERERGLLSTAEKKMLTTAKKLILSEIILSYGIDKFKAEEILEATFFAAVSN